MNELERATQYLDGACNQINEALKDLAIAEQKELLKFSAVWKIRRQLFKTRSRVRRFIPDIQQLQTQPIRAK